MFAAWGTWVARFRWPVFAVTLAAVIAAGVWGLGVFGQLTEGGYNDPDSESTKASEVVQEALGAQGGDLLVIYTPARGSIDDAVLQQRVENRLAALPGDAVTATTSYWQGQAPQFLAADKRSAIAALTLAGDGDAEKLDSFRKVADRLDVPDASYELAGGVVLADATSERSTRDLAVAEAISLPIVLVLLLLIFGSLVAAALPVLVGGAAVLGSLGVLHGVAYAHDVNSFAVNVASLLGLGMAIDYGLFMVGRFREEQEYGRTPAEAVSRTVATAGRTVLFSATLLMIALAGLLLFPQGFLKSLAYGGLAAVALAAALSLTMLPALLAILGPRVDKLPIRLPKRRDAKPAGTGWARLAHIVLHRPILVALPIVAGLLILAAPIRGVTFGEADERVLPAGDPSRQAIETLKTDYPQLSSAGVQVVLRGTNAASAEFAAAVGRVGGISAVTPAGAAGNVVALTATLDDPDPFSTSARDAVDGIRALTPPAGTELLVGGTTARNVDSLQATADRLPLMIGLLVGATLILMFLAFGSILLPIKAVVVSALSLAATFGILVWIFQDGHGAGLLDITPAPPEVGIVVLMAAVVFGLSTDYEVFLLSRMVEARTRGATTAEAVTTGLARTGRVISAAALLLIVVTGAFALSTVTTMRFVGIGMIIALVLDATVVRMVLVPAILSLLGNAAWWAPGPLRRLQEKAGLSEYAGEELFPTVSVGRHAAPEGAPSRYAAGAGAGTGRPRHASANDPVPSPSWAAGTARELPATALATSPATAPTTASASASAAASADGESTPVAATAAAAAELRVPGTARPLPADEPGSATATGVPIGDLPVVTSDGTVSVVPVRVPAASHPDDESPTSEGAPPADAEAGVPELSDARPATPPPDEPSASADEQPRTAPADEATAAVRVPTGERAAVPTGERAAVPTGDAATMPSDEGATVPTGEAPTVPADEGATSTARQDAALAHGEGAATPPGEPAGSTAARPSDEAQPGTSYSARPSDEVRPVTTGPARATDEAQPGPSGPAHVSDGAQLGSSGPARASDGAQLGPSGPTQVSDRAQGGSSGPARVPTGEQSAVTAAVRVPTGERTAVTPGAGRPADEAEPGDAGSDDADRTPAEERSSFSTTGRAPTGERPFVTPGERPAAAAESGDSPTIATPADGRPTARVPADDQAPSRDPASVAVQPVASEPAPIPALTGEHGPVRIATGEQPHVRARSGEHGTVRIPTGEQAAVSPRPDPKPARPDPQAARTDSQAARPDPRSAPTTTRPGTGEHPTVSGTRPADGPPAALEPDDADRLDGSETRTVDLASRMTNRPDDEEPGPDTTAVLDMGPTVDLSSRLEQESTKRRR